MKSANLINYGLKHQILKKAEKLRVERSYNQEKILINFLFTYRWSNPENSQNHQT